MLDMIFTIVSGVSAGLIISGAFIAIDLTLRAREAQPMDLEL